MPIPFISGSSAGGRPRTRRAGGTPFDRIHIRLTRLGWLYVALTLALGTVAVNAGNNLLYLAEAGTLALLALSGVLGHMNLRGLAVTLRLPEEIYAGRPATAFLEIANGKGRLSSFLLRCCGELEGAPVVELRPGSRTSMGVPLRFERRGRQQAGERLLTSVYPFGLIERGGYFRPGTTCIVFPRPTPIPWAAVSDLERRGSDRSLPIAGTGGDYRGLRGYQHGDSLSRIHWKGWLRHRRLLTKEFEAEGETPVMLSLSAVPGPGIEERLSQLAWLVRTSLRRNLAVGLTLPGRVIPPGSGAAHRRQLLTALALHGEPDVAP